VDPARSSRGSGGICRNGGRRAGLLPEAKTPPIPGPAVISLGKSIHSRIYYTDKIGTACSRGTRAPSGGKVESVKELPFLTGDQGRGPFLVVLFFVSATVVAIWGTWEGTLPASEEAVLAETAREILVTGDGWTMHFDGAPVHDLSPLPLWFMASCYRLVGTSEFSARLPFVFFAVLTFLLTYLAGIVGDTPDDRETEWINRGRAVGLLSAILLAASPIFGRFAPHVSFSVPHAFFTALSLLGWLSLPGRRSGYIIWTIGVAGALFVAGADGLVIVVGVAAACLFDGGRRCLLGNGWFIIATVCALIAGGAWLFWNAPPAEGHFFGNPLWIAISGFVRPAPGVVAGVLGRIKEMWVGNLPWSIIAAAAFARVICVHGNRRSDQRIEALDNALVSFITVVFLLLAFTGPAKTARLITILPATAVLSAREFARWMSDGGGKALTRLWSFNQAMVSLFCLLMLLLLATPLRLHRSDVDAIRDIAGMARQLSPENARVGNFRQSTRIQGARLLFYGQRALDHPLSDPMEVARELEADPERIFLSSFEDYRMLEDSGEITVGLRMLYRAGPLVLFGLERAVDAR
jgi:4-amino-4-deoxy-L-arabinose transferase-like glycosyltransferase